MPCPRRSPPPVLLLPLVLLLAAACGSGQGPPLAPAGDSPSAPPGPDGPALRGVEPDHGPLAGGGRIVLRGEGLLPPAGGPVWVRLGTRLLEGLVAAEGAVEAALPPATAPGRVAVGLAHEAGLTWLDDAFRYDPPDVVLSWAWPVARVGARLELHLENAGPLEHPAVTFDGLPATVELLDAATIRTRVPEGLEPGSEARIRVEEGFSVSRGGFRVQGPLAPGVLVINEFLAHGGADDPSGDGTASADGDEFVELVNRSGHTVDLTGLTLQDRTALRHRFPDPTTVPAGGAIVVFGFGNPDGFAPRHGTGHAQVASSGGLGLNNSGDTITLRDADGTVLAEVAYGSRDVDAGRSRQNPVDGGDLPVPASGDLDYGWHDETPGADGAASPGRRVDGSPFP